MVQKINIRRDEVIKMSEICIRLLSCAYGIVLVGEDKHKIVGLYINNK